MFMLSLCFSFFSSCASFKNHEVSILLSCCSWFLSLYHVTVQIWYMCVSHIGSAESQRWNMHRGPSLSLNVSLQFYPVYYFIEPKFNDQIYQTKISYKCVLAVHLWRKYRSKVKIYQDMFVLKNNCKVKSIRLSLTTMIIL